MSLIDLTSGYVSHALSSLSPRGMKSLLMDADTMSAVSVSCQQSDLMSKGVYLFERLDDRRRSSTRLGYVTCVCLVAPTRDNVMQLRQELQAPRYGKYHLYFTRHLVRLFRRSYIKSVKVTLQLVCRFTSCLPNWYIRMHT